MITFWEAKAELKEIAGERYHRLVFSTSENSDGKVTVSCSAYIDLPKSSLGWTGEATTFREILHMARTMLDTYLAEQQAVDIKA